MIYYLFSGLFIYFISAFRLFLFFRKKKTSLSAFGPHLKLVHLLNIVLVHHIFSYNIINIGPFQSDSMVSKYLHKQRSRLLLNVLQNTSVVLYYVMLCYVFMLCYVMLCCVELYCVVLYYVVLCYAVVLSYVMLCCVMLCYVMLCFYVVLCCQEFLE